jgi:hypothetical protein
MEMYCVICGQIADACKSFIQIETLVALSRAYNDVTGPNRVRLAIRKQQFG